MASADVPSGIPEPQPTRDHKTQTALEQKSQEDTNDTRIRKKSKDPCYQLVRKTTSITHIVYAHWPQPDDWRRHWHSRWPSGLPDSFLAKPPEARTTQATMTSSNLDDSLTCQAIDGLCSTIMWINHLWCQVALGGHHIHPEQSPSYWLSHTLFFFTCLIPFQATPQPVQIWPQPKA